VVGSTATTETVPDIFPFSTKFPIEPDQVNSHPGGGVKIIVAANTDIRAAETSIPAFLVQRMLLTVQLFLVFTKLFDRSHN
jgi:hypothetical protein